MRNSGRPGQVQEAAGCWDPEGAVEEDSVSGDGTEEDTEAVDSCIRAAAGGSRDCMDTVGSHKGCKEQSLQISSRSGPELQQRHVLLIPTDFAGLTSQCW